MDKFLLWLAIMAGGTTAICLATQILVKIRRSFRDSAPDEEQSDV